MSEKSNTHHSPKSSRRGLSKKAATTVGLVLTTALLSTPETGSLIDDAKALATFEPLPSSAACQPNVEYKSSDKDGVKRENDINAGVDKFTVHLIGAPVTHEQIGLDFTFKPYYNTGVDSEGEPLPETFPATAKWVTEEKEDGTKTEELLVKADDVAHGIHGLVSADVTVKEGPYKGNEIHCGTITYGSIDRENPESPVRITFGTPNVTAPAPVQPN